MNKVGNKGGKVVGAQQNYIPARRSRGNPAYVTHLTLSHPILTVEEKRRKYKQNLTAQVRECTSNVTIKVS